MKRDLLRILALACVAAALLYGDDAWRVLAYSVGVIVLLVLVSHMTRRIAFNRIDLQQFAFKASEHPIGAAIVFAAIVWFLGMLITSGVGLLR